MRLGTRTLSALGLPLLLALGAAAQNGDKPELTIYAETTKISIPGLDLSKLPKEALKALGGAAGARRSLSVYLNAPAGVPANGNATLDIPAGLQLGQTLPLESPKPSSGKNNDATAKYFADMEKWEFRRYWGCSATVKPGQPKIQKGLGLSAEEQKRALARAGAGGGDSKVTMAFWPNSKGTPPDIKPEAGLPGGYQLKTNYVGNVPFQVPANVDFLDGISATPDGDDLSKAITLSWQQIPNAQGYFLMASASKDKTTMIQWISSEVENGMTQGLAPSGDMKALVQKGILLAPTKTSCTIPAGIFEGCQGVAVQVYAYGASFHQNNSTPSIHLVPRTMSNTILGQKGAKDDDN